MSTLLLDTNIVSFAFKGDSRIRAYEPYLENHKLGISFMTVAELHQWASIRNWGHNRREKLKQSLMINYVVLAYDIAICQRWGELRASRRAIGRPISPQDAWIAVTAMHYKLPLVTHNPKDFEAISDLEIITTV